MWRSTRHQTTWVQICVFTFVYSLVGSYALSNEYYIRRGYKPNPSADYFGYPKGSANCLGRVVFDAKTMVLTGQRWNRSLCIYRCGKYINHIGAYTFLPEKEKCLQNTEVRSLLNECMVLFVGENDMTRSLHVLDLNNSSKFQEFDNFKLDSGCQINGQQYYIRNGKWGNIPRSCITFNISHDVTQLGKKWLRWNSTNATPYMGRIIKLHLKDCRNKNWLKNTAECIVFKAKGKYHYQSFATSTVEPELCPTPSISKLRSVPLTSTNSIKAYHSSTNPTVTTMALPVLSSISEQLSVVMTSTSSVKAYYLSTSPTVTTMTSPVLPSASEQVLVSVVMTPISTPTTSAQTEGSTTPPPKGDSSGQERSNMDSVIIGVVTPCVIVIIVCLLVAVWCKRRSNHKERSCVKAANPSADNPAYERNNTDQIIPLKSTQKRPQVNEDYDNIEYDYATVDGVQVHTNKKQSFYQSLDRDNANVPPQIYQSLLNNPDLKKPGLNKDNADSKEEYSYNHLQHPAYNPPHPKGTSDSSYNSLQKPGNDDYLEPETQINDNQPGALEPVYNVLEGPDGSSAPQDHDPVYNVLEDPDANQHPQDHDPVYNVLEDPDANQHPQNNDPIYNVLEDPDDDYDNAPTDDDQNLPPSGQDNAAYSSTIELKMTQRPSSPDYDVLEGPDGALPDSTYQPLGIRVQDDVYQSLDRRSHSIYQSLEPGDSAA